MFASSKRTWSSSSIRVARVMPRFVRRLAIGDRSARNAQYCASLPSNASSGHDLAHEPEPQRLVGVDRAVLQQEAHGLLVADGLRQRPREPAVGRSADARISRDQAKALGADADVARHRKRQSGAGRHAVHAADDRLIAQLAQHQREPADPADVVDESSLLRKRRGTLARARQIKPGAERVASSRDRYNPDVIVARRRFDRGHDAPGELVRQRVLLLGPVQPQRPYVRVIADDQGVAHLAPSRAGSTWCERRTTAGACPRSPAR